MKSLENYRLSVIIPVYNTEQYLEKCLTSIMEQTWPVSEIIVIDDGSTDNSGIIARQLASKDRRIHVIHQENQGISAARNKGLEYATGEYITFVDSDDYIDKRMYQRLFEIMQEDHSEISICGVSVIYPDGNVYIPYPKGIRKTWNTREALIELNSFRYFNMSFCDTIIKRELFEQVDDRHQDILRFPVGKKCEDFYLMHKVIARAHKISYDSDPFYFYYQRQGSLSRNIVIETAQIDAAREQLIFYKEYFPELTYVAETAYAFANIAVYTDYLRQNQSCPKELRKNIQKAARENFKSILRSNHIPAIKRIQALVFCTNIKLYEYLIKGKKHRQDFKCKTDMNNIFSYKPIDYLYALWHMLPVLILSLIVGALGGLTYEKIKAEHLYAATTKFYVISGDWATEGRSDDYAQIISSQPVIRTVIARKELKDEKGEYLSQDAFLNKMEVSAYDETHVVSITYFDQDPYIACDVANLIREVSMDSIQEIMNPGAIKVVQKANIPTNIARPNTMLLNVIGATALFTFSLFIIYLSMLVNKKEANNRFKMKRLPFIIVFSLLGILFMVSIIQHDRITDRLGPEIIFPTGNAIYKEGDDYSALLNGVKAEDAVDGDCTNLIRIDDVYVSESGEYCTVDYVAKDKSNNVSVSERQAIYIRTSNELKTDADTQEE